MEHSAGKIIKNTVLFTAALILQKIVSFAYFLYLSSRLAPELLGSYVWALSFTTLFSIGMDLGLSPILTRDVAKDDQNDEKYLRNMLGIKLPLIIITLIACYTVLFVTKSDWQVRFLVIGASAVMTFDALSLIFYSFLRAKQQLRYESAGIIGFQLITFLGGVILLTVTGNIVFVMLSLALASFVSFIYSAFVVKFKYKYSLRPAYDKNVYKYFLRLAPAFALSGIFVRIYNVSDSVILGYVKDNAAVGLYSIPAKIVTAFQSLIPGALQATIYPSMSNFFATSKEKLRLLFEKSFNYLGLISIPLALGLYMIAEQAIQKIWPSYMAAVPTFKIMSLALPFVFLAFPTGLMLRACDKHLANTINRGIITAFSVILNLILIPSFGILGAGITFFVVNFLLLILDLVFIRKIINHNFMRTAWYFLRVMLAGAGMVLILKFALDKIFLYGAIGVAVLSFGIFVLVLGVVKKNEIIFFKENIFGSYGRKTNARN
ncbi:MAG: flippase [Patescibacteria group bacterium]